MLQLPGHTVEVAGDPKESTVSYAGVQEVNW